MKKIHVSAASPLPEDMLDIEELYADDYIEDIAGRFGIEYSDEFREILLDILDDFNRALCSDAMDPSPREVRKELKIALDLSRKFEDYMYDMHSNAFNIIIGRSFYTANDTTYSKIFDKNLDFILKCLADVGRLSNLIESALTRIPKGESGRPSYKRIAGSVAELQKLWVERTGSKPTFSYGGSGVGTSGAFLTFCRLVLGPILERYGIHSDLEYTVKAVVYGGNPPSGDEG